MPGALRSVILTGVTGVPPSIDLALLPAEAATMEADCYVVVDLLRATTTIATLFAAGLADLVVTGSMEAARDRAAREGRLLFGEVGGVRPEGFDHGNSPVEAAAAPVAGRGAVLFTTNGTGALCSLAGRGAVVTGAIANASAVARFMTRHARSVVVCAGTDGGTRFALDDFAAAGFIIRQAARLAPGVRLADAAGLAMAASGYEDWIAPSLPQVTTWSSTLISGSRHARALVALGFAADIQFAIREDTSAAVPRVVEHGEGWARLEA